MQICNHTIADDEVIGIGPLMTENKQDPIYPTKRYWFYLHCRQQSIRIESDAIVVGDFNPQKENDVKYLQSFKNCYENATEKVIFKITGQMPSQIIG
jgi:hypothetical protein